MNESSEVTHEEAIHMLCTVRFVSANERDVMRDTQPSVKLIDDCGGKGGARI